MVHEPRLTLTLPIVRIVTHGSGRRAIGDCPPCQFGGAAVLEEGRGDGEPGPCGLAVPASPREPRTSTLEGRQGLGL